MFTGIVEELGTVVSLETRKVGARLRVRCSTVLADLREGESIAVNGVCLTALDLAADSFSADLAPETLQRSNLGDLISGAPVNLERPVTLVSRLSGHIVQGHVDATGDVVSLEPLGDGNWWLTVRVPAGLDRYLVHKGSIAIDGISLTIAALDRTGPARTSEPSGNSMQSAAPGSVVRANSLEDPGPLLGVTIIPHTYSNTTLAQARPGTRLNVEVDVLAKHVEKLLASINPDFRGNVGA